MTRQIPWARVVAEGAAIVMSILLAFGIQAWWEARGQSRAEIEYLEAILDEIDRNLDALDGNEAVAQLVSDALGRGERVLEAGLEADSAAIFLSSILVGAIPGGPPRVSTAVFDDLTSTGRIVIIEDLEIRRAVLDLYAGIEVNLQRMQRRTDAVNSRLYAAVARHIPPGLVRRDQGNGYEVTLDSAKLTSEEFLGLVRRIGADSEVLEELRAAFVEHADQTNYRVAHRTRLLDTKSLLEAHLQ